jgi:phospholipase/carboxylesterase
MKKEYSRKLKTIENVSSAKDSPYVILLHGYGASAIDLYPLSNEINLEKSVNWIFPEAPLEIAFTPFFSGRAWFPLDIEDLQICKGNYSDKNPKGLQEAAHLVIEMIKTLPVSLDNVVLGGFSQGAMVATEVALSLNENIAGLALFSGTLLNHKRWEELALKKAGMPFFQSHGIYDEMLSFDYALELNHLLQKCGLKGDMLKFEDGHTINYECLESFKGFLEQIFKK